jgi:hypothetical protein
MTPATGNTMPGSGGSPPTVRQQAADLGRKATEGARNAVSQVQTQAQTRLERGKQEAATTLSSVANTLRESGSHLREERQDMAGEYIERAARQIERAADFVQNADLRQVVDDVENFARRRPAVFIGSAFAAGLLAARFLKSSRSARPSTFGQADAADSYLDREVPPSIAREPDYVPPPAPGTWQEPPL